MKRFKFKCPACGGEEFDCTMPVPTLFKTCTHVRQDEVVGEFSMTHADYCEDDSGALGDTPEGKVSNIECYECSKKWSTFEDAQKDGAFTEEGGKA